VATVATLLVRQVAPITGARIEPHRGNNSFDKLKDAFMHYTPYLLLGMVLLFGALMFFLMKPRKRARDEITIHTLVDASGDRTEFFLTRRPL